MRRAPGFGLLELLVSLAILSVVFGVAYAAIVSGLRVQSTQEAATSSQAKLRRVTEVFTQELRSAVLGGISHAPYVSGASSVSFMLLEGGAGYQVLPHDSGNNASFSSADNVRIVASVSYADELALEGGQALMVNQNGEAVVFEVGSVARNGPAERLEWRVSHPGCANSIAYTDNTLLFKVKTTGLSFDADSGTIYQREGSLAAQALAFDLSEFALEYVYQRNTDDSLVVYSAPLTDASGLPSRTPTLSDGTSATLRRLQLTVSSEAKVMGGTQKRSYSGQIEMPSDAQVFVRTVQLCN